MLCVAGMPGCGKSIFLNTAREFNRTIISMGDAVRRETKKRGLSPEQHGEVAQSLRDEKGLAAVAHLVLDSLTPDCIIDGIRGMAEMEVFREQYTPEIIAIHTPPKMRFFRLKKRRRAGDPLHWEEFVKRDMRELGFGIGGVIALADYMLLNQSTKKQFERKCHDFFSRGRS
jgi:dephospho-CoA kinase